MHRKVDQCPSLIAAAVDRRATASTVARLLSSQGKSSRAPAPAAPLGLCFPQAPQPSAAAVPAFETITEALIASQQAAGTRPAAQSRCRALPAGVLRCLGTTLPDSRGNAVSRTPAADLARVKVQHPGWVIRRRVVPGQATGYTAHRKFSRGGFQSLHTVTLGGLEQALFLAEKGMLDEAGGRRLQPRNHLAW